MRSIRARLLIMLIGGILPAVLVSYVLIFFLVSRSLSREFDRGLNTRVQSMSHMAEWWDGDLEDTEVYEDDGDDPENLVRFEFAELELPEFQESDSADYYQVWDESGLVYARSPSLDGEDLPFDAAKRAAIRDLVLPGEREGRVAYVAFVPPVEADSIPDRPDTTFFLAFARSTEGLHETLAVLRFSLLISGALTLVAAAALIWLVVQRGLRPLVDIGNEIRVIGDDDLSHRIDSSAKPAELVPVCTRLNEMLGRLEAAFDRERRFNSDVAHELRTPLAELRALAEVSVRREGLSDADRRSYRDVAEIGVRMERLVSALLELSRCSSGQIAKDVQHTGVSTLVKNAWKPYASIAAAKDLRVQFTMDSSSAVNTDPLIFGTILSNLFSNAVEYTPNGGRIAVECTQHNGAIALAFSNTTDRLVPSDLSKVFDTFWRKDGAGNGTDSHLGLGLSLVAALSRVLGVRVECEMPAPGEFRILLLHPL